MPSQAEMAQVTRLIEARLDSRYLRDDGVAGGNDPTWSGYETVVESIDGKLTWAELTESERETILQSNVTWKGFTPEDTLDVIGHVISGYSPERWMDGVRMEMLAERFEGLDSARLERQADEHFAMREMEEMFRDSPPDSVIVLAPRGWEFAETFTDNPPDFKALAAEHRTDSAAAKLRDSGDDYERLLDQAAERARHSVKVRDRGIDR